MTSGVNQTTMRDGVIAGVIAYTLWGFMPVYFKWTDDVSALEVLSHRIVWSVPFGALIIAFRRQWFEVRAALVDPTAMILLVTSSALIAINWFVYIWAIQNQQIFQASLGYYINPLIYVLAGVVGFKEVLRPYQRVAVALATLGVLILTVMGGKFPIIALTLAVSFTAYGVIRKRVNVGAMPGLFIETVVLLLPALAYLLWLASTGAISFGATGLPMAMILILAGPLTATPLLMFAIAARRLPLSLVGFLQFIGPTLQFMLAVVYGERLTPAYLACFILIWIAVALFCFDSWQKSKSSPALSL